MDFNNSNCDYVITVDSYLKNKSEQELKIIKKGLGLCVNLKQKEL